MEIKDGTPYITHHTFKGKVIRGTDKEITLSIGTPLIYINKILVTTNYQLVICVANSENGKKHFARNNDGQGMKRGQLTYAIAFDEKKQAGNGHRLTDEEAKLLETKYAYWLRSDVWTILFNDDFFAADVADLQELAQQLNIKV